MNLTWIKEEFYRFRSVRNLILGAIYLVVFFLSLFLALYVGFDFQVDPEIQRNILRIGVIVILIKLLSLTVFGQFRGLITYFRLPDLVMIFWANLTILIGLLIAFFWVGLDFSYPRRVILLDFVFSMILLSSFRFFLRIMRERYGENGSNTAIISRVAILGAGDLGARIANELFSKRGFGRKPVIFLDHKKELIGHSIHGIPVMPLSFDFKILKNRFFVSEIIIATSEYSPRFFAEVLKRAQEAKIKTEIVPGFEQFITGRARADHLRPIGVEDILNRAPVALDSGKIGQMLSQRVILVTGAGGSIGSELCRQILRSQPQFLILVEQCEVQLYSITQELEENGYGGQFIALVADVTDIPRMKQIFNRFHPAIVFHAAAHKHVPIMEFQPGEAVKNNSIGTAKLAELAGKSEVERFVLISTDKAINPTNVMGVSKRLAEIAVQAIQKSNTTHTKFAAVRFGNVVGSSGSVVPLFRKQIARGGPLTVTHQDITRYFMTIPEAVGLVLQSATMMNGGDIFVLDMGEPVKIADLARQMIELSGFKPGIDIEIQYIGLRKGEKLFEELQHTGEQHESTDHPHIMRFVTEPYDYEKVLSFFSDFEVILDVDDLDAQKRMLNQFVPEYVPQFN
jgi:FlaA1/EpsC-like NDP-sugar epimerase